MVTPHPPPPELGSDCDVQLGSSPCDRKIVTFISGSPCLASGPSPYVQEAAPRGNGLRMRHLSFLVWDPEDNTVKVVNAGLTGTCFPGDQGRCFKSFSVSWGQRELLSLFESPSQPTLVGEERVGKGPRKAMAGTLEVI